MSSLQPNQDGYLMSRFLRRFVPARTLDSINTIRAGFDQQPIRPPVTLDIPILTSDLSDGRFDVSWLRGGQPDDSGYWDSGGSGDSGEPSGDSGSGDGSGSGGSGDSGGPDDSGSGSGSGESGSGSGESGSGSGSGDSSGPGSGDTQDICHLRSVCEEYYGARFCLHGCDPETGGDYICTTTKSYIDADSGTVQTMRLCLCVQDVPCNYCRGAGGGLPTDGGCNDCTPCLSGDLADCCPYRIMCCYDIGVTYVSHFEYCCSVG